MPERSEQKHKQIWEKLNGLIGKYSDECSVARPTREEVVQAAGDLKIEDFLFLFDKLNEAKEAAEKEFDLEKDKIRLQAERLNWRRRKRTLAINLVKDFLRQIQ